MAASLRAAATRILRPAVLPGAGLRRLVHTEQQHSVPCPASQIKQTKEELYDLIAEAEKDSAASWFDRRLLWRLCTQVEPRPNDPQWCKLNRKKTLAGYAVLTGVLLSCGLTFARLSDPLKIVEYDGYLVTTESLPMLEERRCKQDGYQTAVGVHKQDGYQTAVGVHKQDGYQTAEGVHKQEKMQEQMG